MKYLLFLLSLLMINNNLSAQNASFAKYFPYDGDDLGVYYSPELTIVKIWAPTAELVKLRLFAHCIEGEAISEHKMSPNGNGTWVVSLKGNQLNTYYTVQASVGGKWQKETADPYARAVGANGKRGMIIDPKTTNPEGWAMDKSPALKAVNESIIYELHVRDATIRSNAKNAGKFLGLTETGLKNSAGLSVGLDHIKELGVTHVHLLPFFDFASVDETVTDRPKYNWGYDPLHFNVPEGSYSTNPYDGNVRNKEFKQLVKTFHDNGIRVVMDVVYNHVNSIEQFGFQQLAPNYFFRQNKEGKPSNASGCGNETASERPMVRKFILESVKYWVNEYHIDGFRFDLMAIHDIETMNLISRELRAIKPDILIYGEGWTSGDSPLPESDRALKKHANRLDNIAVFSDDIRDGIKGSVFNHDEKGFVSGKTDCEESIKFGLVGATQHPQIAYDKVNYSKEPYCSKPSQMIAYAECHDNHTLWDRLNNSNKEASDDEKIRMFLLAESIVLTSQGIPFIHAGGEFCRTKLGVENSFESSDDINFMDWERKTQFKPVFDYMQQMIAFRKAHPAFHIPTQELVQKHLVFLPTPKEQMVAFNISGKPNGEKFKQIMVVFNANTEKVMMPLPKGKWRVSLDNLKWEDGSRKISEQIEIAPQSTMILYQK
jgi:pullulanase